MRTIPAILASLASILLPTLASAAITSNDVGLVINDNDQYSVAIGEYYKTKRSIPEANIIHVSIPVKNTISADDMLAVYQQVWNGLPPNVKAVSVAWTKPYVVVTSETVNGLDTKVYCKTVPMALAAAPDTIPLVPSGVCLTPSFLDQAKNYNKDATGSPLDYKVRPTMMLAGRNLSSAKSLIDTSVDADNTNPSPNAYISSKWVGAYTGLTDMVSNKRRLYNFSMYDVQPVDVGDAMFMFSKDDYRYSTHGVGMALGSIFLKGDGGGDLTESMEEQGDDRNRSILSHVGTGISAALANFPYGKNIAPPNFETIINRYVQGDSLGEAIFKSFSFSGFEIPLGDPLTTPFAKAPIYISHDFALKAGSSYTFKAESADSSYQYTWEMPDGTTITGDTVSWSPPFALATKYGKEYNYNLIVDDGLGNAPVRTRRVLVTTETPTLKFYIDKPANIYFGNSTASKVQKVSVNIVDNESEFPIFNSIVFNSGTKDIRGFYKKPRPFDRVVKLLTSFHTDKTPNNIQADGKIPLFVSASRSFDTTKEISETLDTPALIGYTFPKFGIYGYYSGYKDRPMLMTVRSLDPRWKQMPDNPVTVTWKFPDGVTSISEIIYQGAEFPYQSVTFGSVGNFSPIQAVVTDTQGNSYTAKAGVKVIDGDNAVSAIQLWRYYKFDVPKQCVGLRVKTTGLALRDSVPYGEFKLDGNVVPPTFCIKDTLPHVIEYSGVSHYGLPVQATLNYQLTENQPIVCTFKTSTASINEKITYFATPKCSDIDGKIIGISYSIDDSKPRSLNNSTISTTKKFDEPVPVMKFVVKENHGTQAEFIVDKFD